MPSIPANITIDFDADGFTEPELGAIAYSGGKVYTKGDVKITYDNGQADGYWFMDINDGENNTPSLSAMAYTGAETITVETTSGDEFNFVSFFINAFGGGFASVTGYRDGQTTGTQTSGLGFGLAMGEYTVLLNPSIFGNVDKVVITSNPTGFYDGFDSFVLNTVPPTITNATYDASTGTLAVTAADMAPGGTIDVGKLSLTGQGGASYTLTTANVTATSATAFTVTLNPADQVAVNGLLNQNGSTAVSGTAFNLAAATGWIAGAPADQSGNVVTVSNVTRPTITNASYDASAHTLTVTGASMVRTPGSTNDIAVGKITLRGEGGTTYTLTSSDVEITDATSFTVTLNVQDQNALAMLFNKNGTLSTSGTTYNLAAADDWNGPIGNADTSAATTPLTVANVPVPTITNAAYNAATGALVVTGTGFSARSGGANDIDASQFTFTGEGGVTYTLTDTADVEISSSTEFMLTLSTSDKAAVNQIINSNGNQSTGGTIYNLAAAEDWAAGADAAVAVADTMGNPITVSNVPVPTITSAAYDAATGKLVVTGTGFSVRSGPNNDIVSSKFTFRGEGGMSHQLSSTSSVEITSATSFTLTLSTADRNIVNAIANKNGTSATGGGAYNLRADEDWAAGAAAAVVVADLTGNPITVSNVPVPTIEDAEYDAATGVLVVWGSGFTVRDAANDIVANKFTITGQGGSYTLTDTPNAAIEASTYFALTLSATDKAAVQALLNKNGFSSSGGTTYNLDAADDWAAGADAALNVADATNGINVSGVVNAPPTAGSVAAADVLQAGAGGASYSFTVQYADSNGSIDPATIGTGNVTVRRGTDSLTLAITSATWDAGTNTATYTAAPSGGAWDDADNGAWTIDINANQVADDGGAYVAATPNVAGFVVSMDTTGPTAAITPSTAALRVNETALVTFIFNEEVTGFTNDDLTVTGGTLSAVSATPNPMVWTATFTPTEGLEGTGTITLDNTGITDSQGNAGTGVTSALPLSIDTLAPTTVPTSASFSVDTGSSALDLVTSVAGQTISGDLSAPLGAGEAVEVSLDGATWSTATASGTSYSVAATLTGSGTLHVRVVDTAGNAGPALSLPYVLDNTPPTVQITADRAVASSAGPARITFTFSEAPEGFGIGSVSVSGGTLGPISPTADNRVFHADFTPTPNVASGNAAISVGGYTDVAGNAGMAGALPSLLIDTVAPTAAVVSASFGTDTGSNTADFITHTAAQTITGTLSAPLAGGDTVQVSLDGGTTWALATVSGTSYSLATTLNASGTLAVRVADAAGNASAAYTTPYVLDTVAPAFTPAASTPADAATGVPTGSSLTLAFSEPLDAAGSTLAQVYLKDTATDTLVPAAISIDGSGALVIAPTASLRPGIAYYVTWDAGALVDVAGNAAAAVADEATYHFTTQPVPVTPPPDPEPPVVTPPVTPSVPDNDGIPGVVEDQAPGIPGPGGVVVQGDGNGDGIPDSQQPSVGSIGFLLSPTAESNPGDAPPTFTTLVASSQDGKVGSGTDNSRITSLKQLDAPADAPEGLQAPIGLVSFTIALGAGKTGEDFSLYLDPALGVNGYWKQTASGQWVNLASEPYGGKMVTEGGRTRLDFHIEDGGEFDADGKVDGIITDPGAPAHLPLSLTGQAPDLPHGFWF